MTPRLHADDAALIRLLDGEPDTGDAADHLDGCPECASRFRVLSDRSAGLSTRLRRTPELDPPADLWERVQTGAAARRQPEVLDLDTARQRRAGRGRFFDGHLARAAAIAGLLFAGALAAEPVRDWIVSGIDRALGAFQRETEGPPAVTQPQEDPGLSVGFVPGTDRLVIRVERPQPEGFLSVRFEDREDAVGEVVGASEGTSLVVLPDGFRIRNAGQEGGRFIFRLPRSLSTVGVVLDGRPLTELRPEDGDAEIPLAVR